MAMAWQLVIDTDWHSVPVRKLSPKKHRRRSSSKGSLMPAEAVVILRGFRVATRRSRRMFDHWRCTFYRPDGVHRI